jgi:hypothetical protein
MEEHLDPNWLHEVLKTALKSFNDSKDKQLLMDEESDNGERFGCVGERAIAHRLAVHLERVLHEWGYPSKAVPIATDCEYNRHRGAVKRHYIKADLKKRVEEAERKVREDPKREGWYFFSVFPDIVVHQRGIDNNNLIVIEMKRASNAIDDDYDKLKLELFSAQGYDRGYGYQLGVSVVAMDETEPEKRKLVVAALFIDGKQVA